MSCRSHINIALSPMTPPAIISAGNCAAVVMSCASCRCRDNNVFLAQILDQFAKLQMRFPWNISFAYCFIA